jgi:hypothetical protein
VVIEVVFEMVFEVVLKGIPEIYQIEDTELREIVEV